MSEITAVFGFGFLLGLGIFVWLSLHPDYRTGTWDQIAKAPIRVEAEPQSTGPSLNTGKAAFERNRTLTVNQAGIDIVKSFEDLSLEAYPEADHWLIGYGHLDKTTTAERVISEATAERLLREDLKAAEDVVRRAVTVPLTENEFSALAILTFNIGSGAFWNSTALRLLNEGDRQGAADAILMWNKMSVDGELIESAHLTERREAERDLFLASDDTPLSPAATL